MIWTSALLLTAAMQQPMMLRKAEVSILPPEPLPLGGYTQRKEIPFLPGGDDLKARVLEFEQGSLKVAIVSVEMLTVPASLYREVKRRIPSDVHLFLTATHTHCAPDSQMLNDRMTIKVPGIATFNQKWLDWYAETISAGIKFALSNKSMNVFQSVVLSAQLPLNRPRRQYGRPDHEAAVVGFLSWPIPKTGSEVLTPDEIMLPGWFWFSAHATFYGPDELHTRGDWPGSIGDRFRVPVLIGAIGDVSPVSPGESPSEQISNFIRTALKNAYLDGEKRTQLELANPLQWIETPIALDPVKPHPNFAKDNHIPEALANIVVKNFAPNAANVSAFRLGKIAVVGLPGEPSGALGWRIRNYGLTLGFHNVFVVSHVNGWIGYILEPDDYDRGGYEATLGFHGRLTGERIVDAARSALFLLAHPRK